MAEQSFPRRYGKYLLLDQLAVGGMAEVFLAKVRGAERFERLIAIKCMRPELASDDEFVSMFVDEANVAGQLSHANIVQIYELGRFKSQLYIAMELIEGRDLRAILERAAEEGRTLPIPFAAYVIWSAAQALDYAHRATTPEGLPLNLVHRDISPPNLLMSWEGEVKVVDFGIAKAEARASETRVGVLKGKFAYMAPEQVGGLEIDRRADIFTLGTVLYELVTGTKLFAAETEFEVLEKVKNAIIPDFRQVLPDAPPELLTALYNALAKEPDQRYQYASEMAKGLEPLLIIDRTIFGAPEAAAYLNELFNRETDRAARMAQRRLAELAPADSTGASDDSWRSKTETFRSAFDPSDSAIRAAMDALDDDEDAGADDGDPWNVPTSEMSLRRRVGSGPLSEPIPPNPTDEEVLAEPPPSALGARQWTTGDYSAMTEGTSSKGGLLGWLWVVGLFVVAGILGWFWYQQEQEASLESGAVAEAVEEGDAPADEQGEVDGDFGFVSVKLKGVKSATVYVDGAKVGKAPGLLKVRTGTRTIKVEHPRKKGRTRSKRLVITKKNTRRSPAAVVLSL